MAVPTRREAAALLLAGAPPPWLLAHVSAVAEIAAFLAERIAARGYAIDRRLVETAALLHDIDKLLPASDPVLALGHGGAGARWLADQGHAELSRAVAAHPVTRLADGERFRRWSAFASREERIVAYADKRAGQRLEPLSARFADWAARYPEHRPDLAAAQPRAQRLEHDVCAAAGLDPTEVRRLRWVGPALQAAALQAAAGERPA
ncbi:MAG: HD domain-containing protein [Candidatus Limnocylindrales bacterium]